MVHVDNKILNMQLQCSGYYETIISFFFFRKKTRQCSRSTRGNFRVIMHIQSENGLSSFYLMYDIKYRYFQSTTRQCIRKQCKLFCKTQLVVGGRDHWTFGRLWRTLVVGNISAPITVYRDATRISTTILLHYGVNFRFFLIGRWINRFTGNLGRLYFI